MYVYPPVTDFLAWLTETSPARFHLSSGECEGCSCLTRPTVCGKYRPPFPQQYTTDRPPSHACVLSNMVCVLCRKSRTYSVLSAEEILELEQERPMEVAAAGWGCLNKPVVPRWMAVIVASESIGRGDRVLIRSVRFSVSVGGLSLVVRVLIAWLCWCRRWRWQSCGGAQCLCNVDLCF